MPSDQLDAVKHAGVPAEDGESWGDAADRLSDTGDIHCPGCETKGKGDDVLANNQRWCPNEDCQVVSFWEVADADD